MQARVKNQNQTSIIFLSGRVDVETAEPFRAACLREFKGKCVVFDFSSLSFVGSQGILPFLETLQAFYETSPGSFKFSGVGAEFRKVFAATPLNVVEIHETPEQALLAPFGPPSFPTHLTFETVSRESLSTGSSDYISYRAEPVVDPKSAESFESDEDLEV